MRTFVILLILANLVFLGWNILTPSGAGSQAPAAVQVSPRGSPPLLLLSEGSATDQASPVIVEDTPAAPGTCISLGVFDNTDEGDYLVSALLERGMQARVELLQSGEAVNYRVYMPPFNSQAAARQTLEELQASGLESFIISTGELAGGISLGLFMREDLALALQERLAGEGFASSIQEILTGSNEIWVTIEGLSQALLEGSELLDLLSEGLELDVIEKPC